MNWLTVLVLVIFAYNIYSSHKKGFIKTLFDTATIIVAVLLTTVCAPFIADQISNNEDIYNAISKQVKVMIKETDAIDTNEAQIEFIENMTIPKKLKDYLMDNNTLKVYEERKLDSFNEYIVDELTMILINIITYIVIFIVIRIGLLVITSIVDLISKLPIIEEFNGMGGILIGAVKGLLEVWVLLLVITFIGNTDFGISAMKCINDSFMLDMLYTNNVLLLIIYSFI